MALAQHLFALAGILALAWVAALGLFVLWLLAYKAPAKRSDADQPDVAATVGARGAP